MKKSILFRTFDHDFTDPYLDTVGSNFVLNMVHFFYQFSERRSCCFCNLMLHAPYYFLYEVLFSEPKSKKCILG